MLFFSIFLKFELHLSFLPEFMLFFCTHRTVHISLQKLTIPIQFLQKFKSLKDQTKKETNSKKVARKLRKNSCQQWTTTNL